MSSQRALLPRSTPAASGMSSRSITALLDRLEAQSVECHSIMIVRLGQVVAEGWWAPYSAERPHLLYSLTKSFTSIAVGLAIADKLPARRRDRRLAGHHVRRGALRHHHPAPGPPGGRRRRREAATWNIVPLTGPSLTLHLRSPLMTRPDVA